jgi:hypothetical protein
LDLKIGIGCPSCEIIKGCDDAPICGATVLREFRIQEKFLG